MSKPKTRYADFATGKELLDEIREEQLGRLRSLADRYRQPELKDWIALGKDEAGAKDRHRGRFLFELIQNAHDAIIDKETLEGNGARKEPHLVRIELTNKSLMVANYGDPFNVRNVRAMCQPHETTKSASKQIGHKGIGFKAVLEVSQTPEVYSVGSQVSYSFRFDADQFHREVSEIMGRRVVGDVPLPIIKVPYFCSIRHLPLRERERIEDLFEQGYVTVVRLPWEDERQVDEVSQRLKEDVNPTLLLFMPAISQIEIAFPGGDEVCFHRDDFQLAGGQAREVILYDRQSNSDSEHSRWLVMGPIQRQVVNTSLVSDLGEAWRDVQALTFSLAFQLKDRSGSFSHVQKSQPFYVYFPTQEYSGLGFAVQADFHVRDDRKHLEPDKLNLWLIEEICTFLADDGIGILQNRLGHSAELVDVLAPTSYPESPFGRAFMGAYLRCLRIAEFVPIEGGQYKSPEDCRFPPGEVDDALFRSVFPASRLRGDRKWAYPVADVIKAERVRQLPFLRSEALGVGLLRPMDIVSNLEADRPGTEDCADLIALLARWWDRLDGQGKKELEGLLKTVPILPTSQGWLKPETVRVFQANLRPGAREMSVPPGFEFAIIVRQAYPDQDASRSNQFRLFNSLEAVEYQNREIVRSAILPVLIDPAQFDQLREKNPDSIFGAYQLLKEYSETEKATTGFQDRLSRVPVPATDGGTWQGWKAASECYVGENWPNGQSLQFIYEGFRDCYFLDRLQTIKPDSVADINKWLEFFCWLGVKRRPTLYEASLENYKVLRWNSPDPFGGADSMLWKDYLAEHADDFQCKHPTKRHGASRQLREARTLHHFADLVRNNDRGRLRHLYDLIANNWSYYSRFVNTTLACWNETTGCPTEEIENYFIFQLRRSPWLSAQVGDRLVDGLECVQQLTDSKLR